MLDKLFKLTDHNTNVKTEVLAGITTFMTMAYIIIVNPDMLSATGMDKGAIFTATCLSAALGTILMALLANYPFVLAPGMGLNAFFAFYVVLGPLGLTWQQALAVVFISGIIFLFLTVTNAREAIVNAIPTDLKLAVGAGIGLFIAFIGLKNGGLIVADENTFVTLGNLHDPKTLLTVIGLLITTALVVRNVKGSLLWAIIATTIIGVFMGVVDVSNLKLFAMPPSMTPTFGAFWIGLQDIFSKGVVEAILWLIPVLFAFTFVDLFDTIGTLVGVSAKAGFLDEEGKLPKASGALFADSIATTAGAIMGTSTVTTYVESASGVAEGGRTGLTSITSALLFLLALFFFPLVGIVPAQATAPVLIVVGVFMMESVMNINFSDYLIGIPAFFAIVMMPFTFSIADGIVFSVISYTFLHLIAGKVQKISITMWILTLLFIAKFIWF